MSLCEAVAIADKSLPLCNWVPLPLALSIDNTLVSLSPPLPPGTEGKHIPDKRVLLIVHPGLKFQAGVLAKRRHNQTEHQGDADKHSWQDNL